jgi:hypothetical protein
VIGWLWFTVVQLIQLLATVLGWVVLIPFCLTHAWYVSAIPSVKDNQRRVDRWRFAPVGFLYDNPEDGVSGIYALIWINGVLSPYMPDAPAWWRAYCWSAWRNSCDNLKYVFAWSKGPQALILGRKVGWWPENGRKVPVL